MKCEQKITYFRIKFLNGKNVKVENILEENCPGTASYQRRAIIFHIEGLKEKVQAQATVRSTKL